MDVHDLLPVNNTEVQQQLKPPLPSLPPIQHIDRSNHSMPLPQFIDRWTDHQKLQDCSSYGDKFIYVFTCCNFRYQPGCDTEGYCYCCGKDYSSLSNGWCSLLSPLICCCCPCILMVWAGYCDYTQKCCRGDPSN